MVRMNFLNFVTSLAVNHILTEMWEAEPFSEMSEWVEYMTFDGVSPMAESARGKRA